MEGPNEREKGSVEDNNFTEMCSGSEAGEYGRRIDFLYNSTLGLRVTKKKMKRRVPPMSSKVTSIEAGSTCLALGHSNHVNHSEAAEPPTSVHGGCGSEGTKEDEDQRRLVELAKS